MKIDGREINCMYAKHTETGIDLYGAFFKRGDDPLVVYNSTKNQELAQQLYGARYTNDRFIEKLKNRPTHNFIGCISGPISMPIDEKKVIFID